MYEIEGDGKLFWITKNGNRVSARYPFRELAEAQVPVLEAQDHYTATADAIRARQDEQS